MRLSLGALGVGPLPPPEPSDEESSQRNAHGRPYPWYCSMPGGSLFGECALSSVEQINREADQWLRNRAARGLIDPDLVDAGIARSRAVVAADCAARPADCASLDAYAGSPGCVTLFGSEFCAEREESGGNILLYAGLAVVAVVAVVIVAKG